MNLRILTTLLLPLLLLSSPAPAAANSATVSGALTNLSEVARLIDAAVLDFNMLMGEDQNPIYRVRLDGTVKSLEDANRNATAALTAAGTSSNSVGIMNKGVNDFLGLMRDNRRSLVSTGAPEGAVVDAMMQSRKATRKVATELYASLEKQAGLTGSPTSEARALALQLQQMSALYIETVAAAGGVAYRSQDDSDATVDALARSFEQRLSKLKGQAKSAESARIIGDIQTKWRFIEKSMLNYHEHTVPFLVDRYTQMIVADLLKLAESMAHDA